MSMLCYVNVMLCYVMSMLCQWGYEDLLKVPVICSARVLAGSRINFEGLAFASKAILRQNTADHAVSQLCLITLCKYIVTYRTILYREETINSCEPKLCQNTS